MECHKKQKQKQKPLLYNRRNNQVRKNPTKGGELVSYTTKSILLFRILIFTLYKELKQESRKQMTQCIWIERSYKMNMAKIHFLMFLLLSYSDSIRAASSWSRWQAGQEYTNRTMARGWKILKYFVLSGMSPSNPSSWGSSNSVEDKVKRI